MFEVNTGGQLAFAEQYSRDECHRSGCCLRVRAVTIQSSQVAASLRLPLKLSEYDPISPQVPRVLFELP